MKTGILLVFSSLVIAISVAASAERGALPDKRDGRQVGATASTSTGHRFMCLALPSVRSQRAVPASSTLEAMPGASAKRPLTRAQMMGLVAGGVSSKRVTALVAERGIAFQPTPDFLTDLKSAGATDAVLSAVRVAAQGALNRKEDAQNMRTGASDRTAPPDELKNLQETEQQDRAAEVARPQDASVRFALGDVLAQEGKWDEAAAQYAAVTGNEPSDPLARNNLGVALRKSGDVDGAIREYREALAIDPELSGAHDNLGVALSQKGDAEGAMAEFREAVRQDPRNSQAHSNLGSMLEQRNNLDGAIREYRQALNLGGDDDIRYNLATALELKGDLDGAVTEFRQTLSTRPNDAKTHAGLAGVLERKEDLVGALQEYSIAMKLAPQDPTFRANYARVANARTR